ncbi:MAG: hypothetical protein SPG65_03895, partial [Campylobacter sp.]|nr:hypothetical protein [Campylobacter sp.]
LGILASVAIPRLAATREDAEISAAVANLRTLVNDATAYYTAKGEFGNNTKWSEITNVPLKDAATTNAVGNTATAHLTVGGKDCIGVQLQDKATQGTTTTPAHILITKASGATGVCSQVVEAGPVKAYLDATGVTGKTGSIAIGSSTSVYKK